MSKFKDSVEKIAYNIINRFFLHLERRKRYNTYKKDKLSYCPRRTSWNWFLATFTVISVIATLGYFSEGFVELTRNGACILKGKQEYCYRSDLYYIEKHKEIVCKKYIKEHINSICKPTNNNLNITENDSST